MGKKYTTILTLFAIISVLFAGCEQDERHATGYGTMNIQLSANPSMIEVGSSSDTRGQSDKQSAITTTRMEEVPEASSFSLSLSNEKAEVKHWDSYADFKEGEKIAIGNYTLKAYYGDEKKEGFNAAYYEGSTNIQILENQNTTADITCYIANVQLTVICSEAVQKYFTTFEMQARSNTGTTIDIAKDDQRPVYLKPGSLQLEAKVKKQNGIGQTLRLLDIDETEARQHYIIQVDVNGGDTGSGTLNITYNTVKSEEVVTIDISDASLNLKAPEFTAQGFDNGQTITLREGSQPESMKVTLNARAGIRECDLLIESPYLNSEAVGIDGLVKLVPTSDAAKAMKQKVVDKGLRLLGLEDGKIERLALIDFTQLIMNMVCTGDNDESSKFTLRAVDKRGVVHETELSFTTTLQSNQFSFPAIAKTVLIGSTEAEAEINLLTSGITGEQDVNNVIFEYKNEASEWVKATTEWVSDNTEEVKKHKVKIKKLPEIHRNLVVRARYGSKISEEQTLSYHIPEFTITADENDIWARKATLQVKANTVEAQNAVLKYLKLTYNGSEISTTRKGNTYLWSGLEPGVTYTIVGICNEGGEVTNNVEYSLLTEAKIQLPNPTFNEWTSGRYNGTTINKGGPWAKRGAGFDISGYTTTEEYQKTTLSVNTPVAWENVNEKTMPNLTGNAVNTWYIVPSTDKVIIDDNTYVRIRNVSWSGVGGDISPLGSIGYFINKNECYASFPGFEQLNTPSITLQQSAGRLFLGSYSYQNEKDIVNEGYPFFNRPSQLKFKYKYTSKTSGLTTDKGYVRIMLRKGSKSILKDKEYLELDLDETANILTKTLDIQYPSVGCEKPDNICIMFCSSIGGKDWLTSEEKIDNPSVTSPESKAQACVTGSELYIDDIELIY